MSTVVVDPVEHKQSGNLRGSCIQPVEQLPQAYWSDVGWQPLEGGTKLLIGSSLEEWQMLPLDESYAQDVVQVCNEELGGDHLETSSSMWMEDATTAAPSVQLRFCEDSYDNPLGDLPMSPTYELQLQDYPLPEHTLADEFEAEQESLQPQPDSLSGSWLDTTSYVDQLTNYDQFLNPNSSSSAVSTNNIFSIAHASVSTADNLFSATSANSNANKFRFTTDSGVSFSIDDDDIPATKLDSYTDVVSTNNLFSTTENGSTTNVRASDVLVKPDPVVEEVNQEAEEEVMAQLMKELGAFQQSRGDDSSGPASLGSITGADLEELVAQMFGTGASDDQWLGTSVDPMDSNVDNMGSTINHLGSTVDPEVLWNVDGGYQTSTSTSPSSSGAPDVSVMYLTSDSADISVGFVEDVVTEDSVAIDESSALAQYFLDTKSQRNSSRGSSVRDESDDYDESLDYSDDDDSLSDEEFRPSSYHNRSYAGTKRRGRSKMSSGKRKRREEYALLSPTERRERKREQNKNAATKYREKKRLEELERDDACDELEQRNAELRKEVMDKEREVKVLRRLVINIFRQSPNEVLADSIASVGNSSLTGKKRKLLKVRL